MKATYRCDRKPLCELDEFRNLSHSSLLEQPAVQQLFYWEAIKYSSDSWEDLCQRAYIMFLEAPRIRPVENFGFYLSTVAKNTVSKAHQYRHRKKRFLQAKNFVLSRKTGKLIEPVGESAAILFSEDDVAQIRWTIWKRVKDESRRKVLMAVLNGFLDGESCIETASRIGKHASTVSRARVSLKSILSATPANADRRCA